MKAEGRRGEAVLCSFFSTCDKINMHACLNKKLRAGNGLLLIVGVEG